MRRLDQLAPDVGIAQCRFLFGERQLADITPYRQLVERHHGLEREHDVQRAAVHLDEHAAAGSGGFVGERKILAPVVRRAMRAEHAERDRYAGVDRERLEAILIIADALRIEPGVFGCDFEHARAFLTHHTDQLPHLVPIRETARDRLPVGRLMVARARGREADCAGANRAADFALHRGQIFRRGLIGKRAFAHYVGAQRRMANVGGVVDALRSLVDRVEVLRKRLPRPLDTCLHRLGRDVLGTLEIAHHEQLVLLGTGRERKPAVAHHDRRDAVPARAGAEGIPEHLRVHMRVGVDDARRDDMAFRVDDFLGALMDSANGRDFALRDTDVGAITRQPGAVDDSAVANYQVVHPFLLGLAGADKHGVTGALRRRRYRSATSPASLSRFLLYFRTAAYRQPRLA